LTVIISSSSICFCHSIFFNQSLQTFYNMCYKCQSCIVTQDVSLLIILRLLKREFYVLNSVLWYLEFSYLEKQSFLGHMFVRNFVRFTEHLRKRRPFFLKTPCIFRLC
jgi:hypothetical protein